MPTGVSRMWCEKDDVSIPQMSRFPSLVSMTGGCYILYIYITLYTLQSCYQKSARQIHHSLSANFLGSHSSHTISHGFSTIPMEISQVSWLTHHFPLVFHVFFPPACFSCDAPKARTSCGHCMRSSTRTAMARRGTFFLPRLRRG